MTLAPDRVEVEIRAFLDLLARGLAPAGAEREHVDVKEEPGRRRGGVVQPGLTENEQAAVPTDEAIASM